MKYLIIGGSDAGISAALRIKEMDKLSDVHIFLSDAYPNYSICGIPFYFSREVQDWKTLAHRSSDEIVSRGIKVHQNQPITSINVEKKAVFSHHQKYTYDKLLLATGARSFIPEVKGMHLAGVFTLRWIGEMLQIDDYILKNKVKKVLIVGGGYIGLEMADALTLRGLKVQLVEMLPQVMATVDESFASLVKKKLESRSVEVFLNTSVESIESVDNELKIYDTNHNAKTADLVLIAVGAQPESSLAKNIHLPLGIKGAIKTNQKMETPLPDVYAAGDCAETHHALLKKPAYLPLGTTAHKQGRVAGENMAGGNAEFHGSLGSQVVKIFDMVVGRTGLNDLDCEKFKLQHVTAEIQCWDHKVYYPHAERMNIRITGNPETGELYGAQLIGHINSEISKRIDVVATAIHNKLFVSELNELDLTYTPPLSSPWDPVQLVAQEWLRMLEKKKRTLS